MNQTHSLHEDAFYEYFKPYKHPEASFDIWGGHGLETFGADLDLVHLLDPLYVWTIVEGECDEWIVSGVHFVNRICYLVTERPHNNIDIEFRTSHKLRMLTPLGLRRQITCIDRLIQRSR